MHTKAQSYRDFPVIITTPLCQAECWRGALPPFSWSTAAHRLPTAGPPRLPEPGPKFPTTWPKPSWEAVPGGLGETGPPSGPFSGHTAPEICWEVLGQGMCLALTLAHATHPWEKLNDALQLVTPAVL